MINYHEAECDPDVVEALVKAASNGLRDEVSPDLTTDAELVAAVFTLLDRTLRALRKLQSPECRFENASIINKILQEMMIDHGNVPH